MKIYRRSDAKINADIDILNFIETQRRHKASLYGLMTKYQKKLSKALSYTILSEYSSAEDTQKKTDLNNITPHLSSSIMEEKFDFLDEMFVEPTEIDIRYLQLYEKIDRKRKQSWLKMHPEELEKANIRYLKFLMMQNLSDRVKKKIVVNP
jgi:hypothetical protein